MKKIIFKFIFVLTCFYLQPLLAKIENSLEIRTAAFFHSSDRFREIYGNVSGSYQLEVSTKWRACNCYETWVNFDWFSKEGQSDGFEDPTKANIANLSFGIKISSPFCEKFTPYIGLGPSFSRIWLKNESRCHDERVSKVAVGVVFKSGINYFVTRCVFIDLFVDYLYQPVHFEQQVDIGGFKTGAGLGFKF